MTFFLAIVTKQDSCDKMVNTINKIGAQNTLEKMFR